MGFLTATATTAIAIIATLCISNSLEAETGCGSQLLLLAPCAPFAQGAAPAPPDACCDGIADVDREMPRCLCLLLDGSISLPFNRTLARKLPALCLLDGPKSCPGLVLPPLGSPTANSSAPGSSTAMISPPARMIGLLTETNLGGKLRVEGASAVVTTITLLVAGGFF